LLVGVSDGDRLDVVLNGVLIAAQTRIRQPFVVADGALQDVIAVARAGYVVMGKSLLVLAQIVVTLPRTHVEKSTATGLRLQLL